MTRAAKLGRSVLLAVPLAVGWQVASARIDAEDQALIDAASCADLQREYRNYYQAERDAEAAIQRSTTGQVAGNLAGLAALATLGFGFFHWNDNSDARENLAELRAIRIAIADSARKKSCPL